LGRWAGKREAEQAGLAGPRGEERKRKEKAGWAGPRRRKGSEGKRKRVGQDKSEREGEKEMHLNLNLKFKYKWKTSNKTMQCSMKCIRPIFPYISFYG
jgi:hypothetical protein